MPDMLHLDEEPLRRDERRVMPALDTWLWAAGIVCVFGSLAAVAIGIAVDSARRESDQSIPRPGRLGNTPWPTLRGGDE